MAFVPINNYRIGSTSSSTLNVENIIGNKHHPPKSTFIPYSQPVDLGDGTLRGAGWATATWTWSIISRSEYDLLRALCPGASAIVYILTRGNDTVDAYTGFQAVIIWPQEIIKDATRRTNFEIKFRRMIATSVNTTDQNP